jgi:hypothetical protein
MVIPVIGPAAGFTVTTIVAMQPVPNVYEITAVPAATPPKIPDVEPMVATEVLLLLHVPPPVALLNIDV